MPKNKDLIKLFKAIYTEYGYPELLKRMTNILHLSTSEIEPTGIVFNKDNILIADKNPLKIEFHDEGYQVIRYYETYTSYKLYDSEGILIKRTITYQTPNNTLLVLDNLDADLLENYRITKTTTDDSDFFQGFFERETMRSDDYGIEESYRYQENENHDIDERKIITTDSTKLYSRFYQINDEKRSLNTAVTLGVSETMTAGRIRRESDLLPKSIRIGYPNILFKGIMPNKDSRLISYSIDIVKQDKITINITIYNLLKISKETKTISIPSLSKGSLTELEITSIINALNNLPYEFIPYLIEELNKIIKQLYDHNSLRRDIDPIELAMFMHPNFDEFAFHLYEHLDAYNQKIDEQLSTELNKNKKKLFS